MSPITHGLIGWLAANCVPGERRDRAWITAAAVVSDLDGLGLIAEVLTRNSSHPLLWWSQYHHVLGHNLIFGFAFTVAAFAACGRRGLTAVAVLAAFHSHLLGDILGGRGPDGDSWPIFYWWPFSTQVPWTFAGQWALNAWPNFVITAFALALTLRLAWRRGYSPLEFVSLRADAAVTIALRRRWPNPE